MESLGSGGIILIAFVSLVILLFVYSAFFRKKRADKIQQDAANLGITQLTDEELATRTGDLTDFLYPNGVACELEEAEERKRQQLTATSGWSKTLNDLSVTIFDLTISHRYLDNTTSGGSEEGVSVQARRGGMTVTQTVVLYQLPHRPLPKFVIAERLAHEAEYVTIKGSTQLGKHYRCCALPADKAQVEALFSDGLLDLLESERLWCIESHEDRLIVYQNNWLTPADRLAGLIETSDRVCTLLGNG